MASRLGALVLLVVSFYAVTAHASQATSPRGEGAAAISGIAVTNVHYSLNSIDPSQIDAVKFTTTSPSPVSTIRIQLRDDVPEWYSCYSQGGAAWSCATPGARVQDATVLRVVSAG